MLIGHLPAGYLAARYLWHRYGAERGLGWNHMLGAALLGNVFPDIDWLYYYLIDHRRHYHHAYWTHLPVFWLLVVPVVVLSLRFARHSRAAVIAGVFGAGAFLHLLLDSIAGRIWWLYPWVDEPFSLFAHDGMTGSSAFNFVLRCCTELALLSAATYIYVRSRNPAPWES
ncbi:MAG: hydrolase [Proteobacteria bacterium]|nr:MAG: hydrolase [Pseudomonadota bacterium]